MLEADPQPNTGEGAVEWEADDRGFVRQTHPLEPDASADSNIRNGEFAQTTLICPLVLAAFFEVVWRLCKKSAKL